MSVDNRGGHNGPGDGLDVQSPDWEKVARDEFSFRVQDEGDELRNEFYKVAALLMDGHNVGGSELESLRSELRHRRTFVEENVTKAATYTPTNAVHRLRTLEWEMLQFYQLIASEISRGAVSEDEIGRRMKQYEELGEELEELLRDVEEGA